MTDVDLVALVKAGDQSALQQIYQNNYAMVRAYILSNNGDEAAAKDIYQEAMIVLYENIRSGSFEVKAKLKTYLYAVSRRLWLKELKKNSRYGGEVLEHQHVDDWSAEMDAMEERQAKKEIVDKSMVALGEPCKTILTDFFYHQYKMDEIAEKMGYTNAANAKNQKYKCFQRFKKLVLVNSRT